MSDSDSEHKPADDRPQSGISAGGSGDASGGSIHHDPGSGKVNAEGGPGGMTPGNPDGGSKAASGGSVADRHLWEFAWVRDLLVLALAALLLWLIYAASAVFTPVLVGLALAYVFNPVVTFCGRYGLPRWLTSLSVLLVSLVILAGALLYLTPKAIGQVGDLFQNVPGQVRRVADRYDWKLDDNLQELRRTLERTVRQTIGLLDDAVDLPPEELPESPPEVPSDANAETSPDRSGDDASERAQDDPEEAGADRPDGSDIDEENGAPEEEGLPVESRAEVQAGPGPPAGRVGSLSIDYQALAQGGWQATRWLVARLWEVVGFFTWLFLFALLASASFFFFSWHLPEMGRHLDPLLPPGQREVIWRMIERMDRAVSAWFRGRLLQSLVVGVLLSVGWWAVGVPYWLLLGVLGGVLNLIPYAAGIAWPLAVGLMWINSVGTEEPTSLLWILLAPSVVYWVAQTIDGSVMEPLVQGKATELNWLVVLVSVMAGGALFGFIGLILAIPVMACVKIVWQEWLNPRLTAYLQTID